MVPKKRFRHLLTVRQTFFLWQETGSDIEYSCPLALNEMAYGTRYLAHHHSVVLSMASLANYNSFESDHLLRMFAGRSVSHGIMLMGMLRHASLEKEMTQQVRRAGRLPHGGCVLAAARRHELRAELLQLAQPPQPTPFRQD